MLSQMTVDRSAGVVAVLALIESAGERATPLMVAIDGMSAAGKSTLAAGVVESLPDAELIRGDDFYRVMTDELRFELSPERGYHEDYDWQRLLREVLTPLRRGATARFRRYDWSTGRLGRWAEARPASVVIVEGVYVMRPELRPEFDLTIWVETRPEVRTLRQSQRDDTPEWVARWDRAERLYVARFRPPASADLVVSGDASWRPR